MYYNVHPCVVVFILDMLYCHCSGRGCLESWLLRTPQGELMEARTQTPTLKESTIVERVARIVSSVRGAKADYTRLAAELEPAIPFDVFGVVLLRHDRQAVRVTVCQREGNMQAAWTAQYHQHPLEGS